MGKCPECGNTSHKLSEFWCDPRSGEFSASRLVFLVVNLVFLPSLVYLAIAYSLSFKQIVELILGLNAAPTLVYGFNSALNSLTGKTNGGPQG